MDSVPDWSKALERAHPVLAKVEVPFGNGRVVPATGYCLGGNVVAVMRDFMVWSDWDVGKVTYGGLSHDADILVWSDRSGAAFLRADGLDVRVQGKRRSSLDVSVHEPVIALDADVDAFDAFPGEIDSILPDASELAPWPRRALLCRFGDAQPGPGAAVFDSEGRFVGFVVSYFSEKGSTMVLPAEHCN